MRRSSVILVALCLLAGCSASQTAWGPPVPLAGETTTGSNAGTVRRSIGVISLIGDTFWIKKVGIMVFGNELAKAPVAAWRIDEHAIRSVATALDGKAEVKPIAHDPAAFAEALQPGGAFRDSSAELAEAVRRVTAGQTHDLYVVLAPFVTQFGDTNQSIGGLGIVQSGGLLVGQNAWVHALFTIRVYDGKTRNQLGWKIATIGQQPFLATIRGPHRQVDTSWWPQPDKVAGDARLRTVVQELVQQAIATTLPEALDLKVAQRAP